jgi:hypothetical protein
LPVPTTCQYSGGMPAGDVAEGRTNEDELGGILGLAS